MTFSTSRIVASLALAGAVTLGVAGVASADSYSVSKVTSTRAKVAPKPVYKTVPVGYVLTSSGRLEKVSDGVVFLKYTEITKQKVGDPGDGEFYEAR